MPLPLSCEFYQWNQVTHSIPSSKLQKKSLRKPPWFALHVPLLSLPHTQTYKCPPTTKKLLLDLPSRGPRHLWNPCRLLGSLQSFFLWNPFQVKSSSGVGDNTQGEVPERLIYLFYTLLDIAYLVGVVSQFMHDSCYAHYGVVCRILRYLKSTPRKGILLFNHVHLRLRHLLIWLKLGWSS